MLQQRGAGHLGRRMQSRLDDLEKDLEAALLERKEVPAEEDSPSEKPIGPGDGWKPR